MMTRQEMIVLQKSLSEISVKGEDTIRMANSLKFLEQKIRESVSEEQSDSKKSVSEKVEPEGTTYEDVKK